MIDMVIDPVDTWVDDSTMAPGGVDDDTTFEAWPVSAGSPND